MKSIFLICFAVIISGCGQPSSPAAGEASLASKAAVEDGKLPAIKDKVEREQAEASQADMIARQRRISEAANKYK